MENPAEAWYCSLKLEENFATKVAVQKCIKIIDEIRPYQILTPLKSGGLSTRSSPPSSVSRQFDLEHLGRVRWESFAVHIFECRIIVRMWGYMYYIT